MFVLYFLLVVMIIIIEDVYLSKAIQGTETSAARTILKVKEVLNGLEVSFIILFILDIVLHGIGYG